MKSSIRLSFITALCLAVAGCTGDPPATASVARTQLDTDMVVIQNVAVFNTETLERVPGMDVIIQDETIGAVIPTGRIAEMTGAHVNSGEGATLVPGLIDMHGHIATSTAPSWELGPQDPPGILRSYLYSGVTTVFDPADASKEAFSRRDEVARGDLIGPRIFTTGKMLTCDGGHPLALVEIMAPGWIAWAIVGQFATAIESEEDAIREVNALADAGADAIKIAIDAIPLEAPLLSRDLASAVARQAKSRGLRTVAHIGTFEDAVNAGDAGVALWVHGVYKEPLTDEDASKIASYAIPMVATSEVFNRYGRAAAGPMQPTQLERETVPQSVFDSFFPVPESFDPGALSSWVDLAAETEQVRNDNVLRLHKAGVKILAGSDVQSGIFPGPSLHRELGNLVAAGLTPAEAIRAATLYPAQWLANGEEPDSGVIAEGKRADLLLVEGDPTRDIAALENIREVILRGNPLERTPVVNAN